VTWTEVDPETGRPAIFDDPVAAVETVRVLRTIQRRLRAEAAEAAAQQSSDDEGAS